jgi:hypothetical protein
MLWRWPWGLMGSQGCSRMFDSPFRGCDTKIRHDLNVVSKPKFSFSSNWFNVQFGFFLHIPVTSGLLHQCKCLLTDHYTIGSKNLRYRRHLEKMIFFQQKNACLEISYVQDCAKYTKIPSKCCGHPGWDIYGILTGYNPLLCFTFTSSDMLHQLRPSNLKLWDMLRRPKKHMGAHYARTPKNYQKPIFFGRVSTGFHGWNTGFLRVSKSRTFPTCAEKRSFRIALRVFCGLGRLFYGSQKMQLPGHHEHDESCNDWSLKLFPCFLAPYTVMLWTSWVGLFQDEDT